MRSNRPRQWIVRDPVLIGLAQKLPRSNDELQAIDGLPPGLIRRSGRDILKAISASSNDNSNYRPPPTPDEAQKGLLKQMQKQVADRAADLGLAAETIASKKELSAVIIGGDRESRVLNGWRRSVIGEQLLELA